MRRGPLLMILASLAFTGMVGLVKVARTDLALGSLEVMGWRGVLAIPVAWGLLAINGSGFGVQRPGLLIARCAFGFGAMFCFYTAAKGLPLGELSVIAKLQPLLVAFVAPRALGRDEAVSPRVWVAIALGLLGTAILVSPDLAVPGGTDRLGYAGLALAASVFSALAHTLLRALGEVHHPNVVVFWFQVAIAVVAVSASGGLSAPQGAGAWWILGGVAGFALLGQLLQTHAYRVDVAARVAAASYVSPLFGFGADLLFFGAVPRWTALVGGGCVVVGGLILVRR